MAGWERDEFRETAAVRPAAILSQAGGAPPEGAETTWGLPQASALDDRLERPAPDRRASGEGEEIVRAGGKLPGYANPLVPGSSPGGPTIPAGVDRQLCAVRCSSARLRVFAVKSASRRRGPEQPGTRSKPAHNRGQRARFHFDRAEMSRCGACLRKAVAKTMAEASVANACEMQRTRRQSRREVWVRCRLQVIPTVLLGISRLV